MHFYEFHIGDYRRRTAHLTPIEHYIYRTLLDWYILDEKPLKNDTAYLLRILSLTKKNLVQLQNVLDDFFVLEEDGCYHNKRADEIIHKYQTNCENGKKGGRPKKSDDNQSKSDVQPNENSSETELKPNKNPIKTELKPNEKATNNQEPLTNNQNIVVNEVFTPQVGVVAGYAVYHTEDRQQYSLMMLEQKYVDVSFDFIQQAKASYPHLSLTDDQYQTMFNDMRQWSLSKEFNRKNPQEWLNTWLKWVNNNAHSLLAQSNKSVEKKSKPKHETKFIKGLNVNDAWKDKPQTEVELTPEQREMYERMNRELYGEQGQPS